MDDDHEDGDEDAYTFEPPALAQHQPSFGDDYDSDATEVDEPNAEEQPPNVVLESELTMAEQRLRAAAAADPNGEPPDVHVLRNAVQLYMDNKGPALQTRKRSALLEDMDADEYRVGFEPSAAPAPEADATQTHVAGGMPKMLMVHSATVIRETGQEVKDAPFEIKTRDGTYRGPLLRVEFESAEQFDTWNRRTGRNDRAVVNDRGKFLPLRFPESFATSTEHTVGVLNYNSNVEGSQGGRVSLSEEFLSKPAYAIRASLESGATISCETIGFDGAVLSRLSLAFRNDQYVGPMHLGDRDTSTDTSGWVVRTRVGIDGDPNGGCHVLGTHCFSTMQQLPPGAKWPTQEQIVSLGLEHSSADALAQYLPGGFRAQPSDGVESQVFSEDYLFALRCDWKHNMPVSSRQTPAKLLSPFGVFELQFLGRDGQIASVERVLATGAAVQTVVKLTFVGGLHAFDPKIHPPEFAYAKPKEVKQCTGTWSPVLGAYFRPHSESVATAHGRVSSSQLEPLVVVGDTDFATILASGVASGVASAAQAPRSMFSARERLVDGVQSTDEVQLQHAASSTVLRRCGGDALRAVKALFAASDPRMHGQSAKTAAYLAPPATTGANVHGLLAEPWGQIEPVAVFEIDYAKDSAVAKRYRDAAERVASELDQHVDRSKNTLHSVASDLDRRVLPTRMRTPDNPRGTDAAIDPFFYSNASDFGTLPEVRTHPTRFGMSGAPGAMNADPDEWKTVSDAAGNLTMDVFTRTHAPLEAACAAERAAFITDVTSANADRSKTRAADSATWGLAPLRSELNETLLLHGVRAADVKDAIDSGLDARFHASGAFGDGIYLYEDAFAADYDAGLVCEGSATRHAGPRPTAQCPRRSGEDRAIAAALGIVPELHLGDAASSHLDEAEMDRRKRERVPSELDDYGDLFFALAVRTALGAPAVTTAAQVKKNCVGGVHTTFDEDFEQDERDRYDSSGAKLFVAHGDGSAAKRLRKGLHSVIGFGHGSVDDSGFGAATAGAGYGNRGQIATHRTFVVNSVDEQLAAAVKPVMLIAYKRVKQLPADFDRLALGFTTLERPLADPFAPPNFPSEHWRDHFLEFPTFCQFMRTAVQVRPRGSDRLLPAFLRLRPVNSSIYTPSNARDWGHELTNDNPRSGMAPQKGVIFAKDGPDVPAALGCK